MRERRASRRQANSRHNAMARRGVGLSRIKLAHKTGAAYGVVFFLIEESAITVGAGTID
jgi:hypothetical protein